MVRTERFCSFAMAPLVFHCDARVRICCWRSLSASCGLVVDLVITDLAVFAVAKRGDEALTLVEPAPDVTVDDVRAKTEADFSVAL